MAVKSKSSPTRSKTKKETPPLSNSTNNKLSGGIKRINVTYILFFLLIVAAFLIGVLFTQVQFLKNGAGTIGGANIQATTDTNATAQVAPVNVGNGHLPILGNKNAKVTLVEFSDFQCPFCEQLFKESLPQIKKDYIDTGKVKLVYRQFPLSSLHPNAQKAAEASECANAQGKFWEYHDQLFSNQAEWEGLDSPGALEKFVAYANNIGLDGEALRECVNSNKMAANVQKDVDEGGKVGVDGTPATFVNGILISGAVPFSDFKTAIDQALASAK